MIKAAILDFDGTLIDSMPGLTILAVEIIKKYYNREKGWARERYLATTGLPFSEQLLEIFGNADPEAVKEFEARKEATTMAAPVFEAVKEFIAEFLKQGECVAVVSSTRSELVYRKIGDQLSGSIAWESGIGMGPKDEQIAAFLAEHNYKPEEAIFFGDSVRDKDFADKAGVSFIQIKKESQWKALTGIAFTNSAA